MLLERDRLGSDPSPLARSRASAARLIEAALSGETRRFTAELKWIIEHRRKMNAVNRLGREGLTV